MNDEPQTQNDGLIVRDRYTVDSNDDIALLRDEDARIAFITAGQWDNPRSRPTNWSTLIIKATETPKGFCEQCDRVIADASNSYWGVCPECHKNDGTLNIGRSHWYFCKEHKTRWFVGANLFSTWKDQTEEEQRKIYDTLAFDTFTDVEPHNCG